MSEQALVRKVAALMFGKDALSSDKDLRRWVERQALTLDFMHEAEKRLTDEQQAQYLHALVEVVRVTVPDPDKAGAVYALIRATAEQRARAFVAVMTEGGAG